jgi:hypothetical protein
MSTNYNENENEQFTEFYKKYKIMYPNNKKISKD